MEQLVFVTTMADDQPITGENAVEASIQNDALHRQDNNSWDESFGLHTQQTDVAAVESQGQAQDNSKEGTTDSSQLQYHGHVYGEDGYCYFQDQSSNWYYQDESGQIHKWDQSNEGNNQQMHETAPDADDKSMDTSDDFSEIRGGAVKYDYASAENAEDQEQPNASAAAAMPGPNKMAPFYVQHPPPPAMMMPGPPPGAPVPHASMSSHEWQQYYAIYAAAQSMLGNTGTYTHGTGVGYAGFGTSSYTQSGEIDESYRYRLMKKVRPEDIDLPTEPPPDPSKIAAPKPSSAVDEKKQQAVKTMVSKQIKSLKAMKDWEENTPQAKAELVKQKFAAMIHGRQLQRESRGISQPKSSSPLREAGNLSPDAEKPVAAGESIEPTTAGKADAERKRSRSGSRSRSRSVDRSYRRSRSRSNSRDRSHSRSGSPGNDRERPRFRDHRRGGSVHSGGYGRSRGRGGRRSGRSGWQDRGRGGGGRYYDRPSRRYWDRSRSRSHSKSRSRTPDERQKDRSRSHSKSGNDRDRNLRPEDPKQRSVERGSNTSVGQPMDAERRLHRSRWENEPEGAEGNEESGPATDTVFETSDFQAAIQTEKPAAFPKFPRRFREDTQEDAAAMEVIQENAREHQPKDLPKRLVVETFTVPLISYSCNPACYDSFKLLKLEFDRTGYKAMKERSTEVLKAVVAEVVPIANEIVEKEKEQNEMPMESGAEIDAGGAQQQKWKPIGWNEAGGKNEKEKERPVEAPAPQLPALPPQQSSAREPAPKITEQIPNELLKLRKEALESMAKSKETLKYIDELQGRKKATKSSDVQNDENVEEKETHDDSSEESSEESEKKSRRKKRKQKRKKAKTRKSSSKRKSHKKNRGKKKRKYDSDEDESESEDDSAEESSTESEDSAKEKKKRKKQKSITAPNDDEKLTGDDPAAHLKSEKDRKQSKKRKRKHRRSSEGSSSDEEEEKTSKKSKKTLKENLAGEEIGLESGELDSDEEKSGKRNKKAPPMVNDKSPASAAKWEPKKHSVDLPVDANAQKSYVGPAGAISDRSNVVLEQMKQRIKSRMDASGHLSTEPVPPPPPPPKSSNVLNEYEKFESELEFGGKEKAQKLPEAHKEDDTNDDELLRLLAKKKPEELVDTIRRLKARLDDSTSARSSSKRSTDRKSNESSGNGTSATAEEDSSHHRHRHHHKKKKHHREKEKSSSHSKTNVDSSNMEVDDDDEPPPPPPPPRKLNSNEGTSVSNGSGTQAQAKIVRTFQIPQPQPPAFMPSYPPYPPPKL